MSPEQSVLSMHPNSCCTHREAVKPAGRSAHYQKERWTIYASPGLGADVLGESTVSEDDAWAAAAKYVEASE